MNEMLSPPDLNLRSVVVSESQSNTSLESCLSSISWGEVEIAERRQKLKGGKEKRSK
ncbi:hypothetical protein RND71_006464 [Anisodus tanguticus]|uniref:Uncharacterized protein n=1 Tax=Anisodus tanguticus TaxID=243964 RepID=A0AAE1VNN6_9SOLA|nr:hypothetical protein RND71_006464 [Anisodus tanguticus]